MLSTRPQPLTCAVMCHHTQTVAQRTSAPYQPRTTPGQFKWGRNWGGNQSQNTEEKGTWDGDLHGHSTAWLVRGEPQGRTGGH